MHLGFGYFKDQIVVEKIRITGSDHNGNSLIARTDLTIANPSSVSVLIDELPVEVYYRGVKVTIQAVSRLALPLTHNQMADFTLPVSIAFAFIVKSYISFPPAFQATS